VAERASADKPAAYEIKGNSGLFSGRETCTKRRFSRIEPRACISSIDHFSFCDVNVEVNVGRHRLPDISH